MTYLADLIIRADPAIAERFPGGFVQRFHYQTLSISIPYSLYCEPRIQTKDIRRIAYVFSDIRKSIAPWKLPLATSNLWRYFDFAAYVGCSDSERKQQILEALHSAALKVAKLQSWNKTSFQNAYNRLIGDDLCFSHLSKRAWLSPDKKYKVSVAYEFLLSGIRLSAVLFMTRKKAELARTELGQVPHSLDWVSAYLSRGRWLSPSMFELEVGDFFTKKLVANFQL